MGDVAVATAKADEANRTARTLRESIKAMEGQFALALPRHVTVDRFMRASLTALGTVRNLDQCTERSVLAGLTQAAQLGLEVSDVRGQCYLIPRRNRGTWEATFQLGYRGMIDLAARAGITVDIDTVFEHDDFDFERGTNARLYHRPTLDEPGKAIAYYAVANFADSRRPQYVLRSRRQIEIHRDRFASQRNRDTNEIAGPWVDHFDAMALKTVIRMLLDKLPTSAELREAIIADAQAAQRDATAAPVSATYTPNIDPLGAIDTTSSTDDDRVIDETTGEIKPKPKRRRATKATPATETAPSPSSAPGDGSDGAGPGDDMEPVAEAGTTTADSQTTHTDQGELS